MKRRLIIVLTAYFIVGVLILTFRDTFYLNLSPSEPLGIYRLVRIDGRLKTGELIIMDVPASARPYIYGRGWLVKGGRLIKNIGALPGDRVWIDERRIMINDKEVGPISAFDSQGRPLPRIRGRFMIQPGYFLPMADRVPHSFDGRYMGPVPVRLIRGKAKCLIPF